PPSMLLFVFSSALTCSLYSLSLRDALPIWPGGFCLEGKWYSFRRNGQQTEPSAPGTPRVRIFAISPLLRISERVVCPVRSVPSRSEEHTSELQSRENLVCRLLLEKKKHTGQ